MGPPTDEDTQTRFLRALAERLPLERVVEAHVFPPIRQGGAETGLAVIAARPEAVGGGPMAVGGEPMTVGGERSAVGGEDDTIAAAAETSAADAGVAPPAAGGAPPHGEVANAEGADRYPSDADGTESPRSAEESSEDVLESTTADEGHRRPPTADRRPDRLTVFSARYRLTLKGPDRGRWEMDVVAEADAPLVTVDAVVRGVQRRAGEGAEPERFTAEQLRALLGAADGGGAPGAPAPGTSAGAR